mmetsp:Transcript_64894/g.58299  ORF Transcript_64894/g.58299 Transcript_64894/m.58299 type:complete len:164 (-) Transcript_64894:23-514(-)
MSMRKSKDADDTQRWGWKNTKQFDGYSIKNVNVHGPRHKPKGNHAIIHKINKQNKNMSIYMVPEAKLNEKRPRFQRRFNRDPRGQIHEVGLYAAKGWNQDQVDHKKYSIRGGAFRNEELLHRCGVFNKPRELKLEDQQIVNDVLNAHWNSNNGNNNQSNKRKN